MSGLPPSLPPHPTPTAYHCPPLISHECGPTTYRFLPLTSHEYYPTTYHFLPLTSHERDPTHPPHPQVHRDPTSKRPHPSAATPPGMAVGRYVPLVAIHTAQVRGRAWV